MRMRSIIRKVDSLGIHPAWAGSRARSSLALSLVVTVTLTVAMAFPGAAGAVTASSGRPAVALAFGASYGAVPRVHSGIDVSHGAGANALSAVDGVVSFAGFVPASAGKFRVGAVSVQAANGHIVTLSPLDNIGVARGELVIVGQRVGAVGASGDGSLAQPHLHLSERVDDRYVDPTHLLQGWIASYASEGTAEGGAARRVEEPHTAGPTAVRTRVSSASPIAPWQPVAASEGTAAEQVSVVQPETMPTPSVPSLSLMLMREFVSHPGPTLGVMSSVGARAPAAGASDRDSAQVLTGQPAAAPRAARWLIDSIGYLGVGLVTLAVGLGFALQISSGTEQTVLIHRLGSLFAVRGERW